MYKTANTAEKSVRKCWQNMDDRTLQIHLYVEMPSSLQPIAGCSCRQLGLLKVNVIEGEVASFQSQFSLKSSRYCQITYQ